jgi:hypothetical protein
MLEAGGGDAFFYALLDCGCRGRDEVLALGRSALVRGGRTVRVPRFSAGRRRFVSGQWSGWRWSCG